jgi:hypothetical protein
LLKDRDKGSGWSQWRRRWRVEGSAASRRREREREREREIRERERDDRLIIKVNEDLMSVIKRKVG